MDIYEMDSKEPKISLKNIWFCVYVFQEYFVLRFEDWTGVRYVTRFTFFISKECNRKHSV